MFLKKLRSLLGILSITVFCSCTAQNTVEVSSPDATKKIVFFGGENNEEVSFSVQYNGKEVIQNSVLELISDELNFSGEVSVEKIEKSTENSVWESRFSELSSIPDNYNQAKIYIEQGEAKLNVIVRAYNEGVAFAFEIPEQNGIKEIKLNENIHYNFSEDYPVWSTPKREIGKLTAQGEYRKIPLSQLEEGCERPLLIEIAEDVKIALAEADWLIMLD